MRRFYTVFPTCVGVFLGYGVLQSPVRCLPHVRGGVSARVLHIQRRDGVFPTCVGVFPEKSTLERTRTSLPHVRGGVSGKVGSPCSTYSSSPRAWGCFVSPFRKQDRARVFPTCVGVFPPWFLHHGYRPGLPHVRGGVSSYSRFPTAYGKSSPRAWGCFPGGFSERELFRVFPTCVGVFPCRPDGNGEAHGLPHVRGGVSGWPGSMIRFPLSSPRAWGCFYLF